MPVISTNTAANSAVRYLNINSSQMSSSLSKLSSGSKITQASDDAAGLAISTRISSDVTTLQQAATNASQATSILQTADGGASNISDILSRMKSLASQSSSATVTDSSRAYLNSEFTALSDQIDSIATGTRYSGQSLLDGTSAFAAGASVLVGSTSADTITVKLDDLTSATLGVDTLDVSTQAGATAAIDALDTAIDTVSAARATIGAQERASISAPARSRRSPRTCRPLIPRSPTSTSQPSRPSCRLRRSRYRLRSPQRSSANQMPQYLLKLLG